MFVGAWRSLFEMITSIWRLFRGSVGPRNRLSSKPWVSSIAEPLYYTPRLTSYRDDQPLTIPLQLWPQIPVSQFAPFVVSYNPIVVTMRISGLFGLSPWQGLEESSHVDLASHSGETIGDLAQMCIPLRKWPPMCRNRIWWRGSPPVRYPIRSRVIFCG